MLSMVKKQKTSDEDQQKMIELQAVTDLNMATAFFIMKRYEKCIEKATLSLELKKTMNAYKRRGKAYGALERFDEAA